MAFAPNYPIVDSATVTNQWNRVSIGRDHSDYINDTVRAAAIAGKKQLFEIRQNSFSNKVGDVVVPMGRENLHTELWVPGYLRPYTMNITTSAPIALLDAITVSRNLFKDCRLIFLDVTNTDSKIDDWNGQRTQ